MIKATMTSMKNELNKMLNEKMILIVIIIIPILVNFLLGYEFSKGGVDHIPMAVIDRDNTSLSRMIVQQFNENEMFNIKYYIDDSDRMERLIQNSKIRVGMIIPKDFSRDVYGMKSPNVLMVYDGSHMPITASVKAKASEILLTLKTGTLIKMLQAKLNMHHDSAYKMATALGFKNMTLYNSSKSYKNFLNIGFVLALVQSGIALMCASSIRKEELEDAKYKNIGNMVGKICFYSALGFLALTINILILIHRFNIPFRGNLSNAIILSIALAISVSTFSVSISSWIRDDMISTIVNAVIFVPNTIMIGYTWPVLSMINPYKSLAGYYPFYHYADNMRDIFLKGLSAKYLYDDFVWYGYFITIVLIIGILGVIRLKGIGQTKEGELNEVS